MPKSYARRPATPSRKRKVSKRTGSSVISRFKSTSLRIFKTGGILFLGLIVASVFWVLLYKYIPLPGTPLMLIRSWEYRNEKSFHTHYEWVKYEMSGPITLAVVASEDANFPKHNGFDFDAIQKAYEYNQKNPNKKRGASTISQQVAKNSFLWPGRSWLRKGLEVYFTFLIEKLWGKKRILEVYVNIAEMGKGIYGVEAASKYYFKKKASKLTRYEATLLASILPNPLKYNPTKPTNYLLNRQKWIRRNMDYIGKMELNANKNEK